MEGGRGEGAGLHFPTCLGGAARRHVTDRGRFRSFPAAESAFRGLWQGGEGEGRRGLGGVGGRGAERRRGAGTGRALGSFGPPSGAVAGVFGGEKRRGGLGVPQVAVSGALA